MSTVTAAGSRLLVSILTVCAGAACAPVPPPPSASDHTGGTAPSTSSTAPTGGITPPTVETLPPAPSSSVPPRSGQPTGTPRSVSINFSGDLLWHNTLWDSAELDHPGDGRDFAPQLAGVRELVFAADVALCHSEVPFAPAGGPYSNYPVFAVPPEIAPALAATGWDVCTTASNHALDAGMAGLVRTIAAHRDVGIVTAGTHATEVDSREPVILTTEQGVRVAVVSSTYGTNGIPLPPGAPWAVSLLDAGDTIERAGRARAAGADVVVVHMHAGDEYSSRPNRQQVEFATAVTASPDVDLVVGQHAHVVQPITRVNDTWVAYGAGNLIAQSGPGQPWTYDGYIATFTFEEGADGTFSASAAEFAPTMITKHGRSTPARVVVVADALEAGVLDAGRLRASAARTREVVRSLDVGGLAEYGS